MSDKIKALALFSGGLDSALAIKTVQNQGVEVIALNFVSHFFGGPSEKAGNMARQLGARLEYVDFKAAHLDMLKNPASGRGKNMNPCIDCHALMFKTAGELMENFGARFLISGEVLGQRPMSQNYGSLRRVQKLSGMGDLILRPLSARQLPITTAEREGWVKREELLGIMGRRRHYQMELMKLYGLKDYPAPGGGCLLTESEYSDKLKIFEQDGCLDQRHCHLFYLARMGRFFRFGPGCYCFVGRHEQDNIQLERYREQADHFIEATDIPGPTMVICCCSQEGQSDLKAPGCGQSASCINKEGAGAGLSAMPEYLHLAGQLFSRYSKVKGREPINMSLDGETVVIPPVDLQDLEKRSGKN